MNKQHPFEKYSSAGYSMAFGNDTQLEDPVVYLFYHLPKCGGMDFYGSLQSVFKLYQMTTGKKAIYARVDDISEIDEMAQVIKSARFQTSGPDALLGLFASHLGDKALGKLFDSRFRTRRVTFIREPLSRTLSAYGYHSMRTNQKASASGFIDFFREEENQNVMSRSLFTDWHDADTVISRLKDFYICTPLHNQNRCLQGIIYQHGLYNVFRKRMNATLSGFKVPMGDLSERVKSEFYKLNKIDNAIWLEFSRNKNEPVFRDVTHISKRTALIQPKQNIGTFEYDYELRETLSLM